MTSMQAAFRIMLIGAGATLFMDIWITFLKQIGVTSLNFAFIGRWTGHLLLGRWTHASIAKSKPIPYELALGWLVHYAVGVAFAGLLVAIVGIDWIRNPSLVSAILVGVGTVAAPFFIMQPAMGLGIAATKTPTPLTNRVRSVVNHAVFGFGLFLSAHLIEWISR